ncbi:MAG: hypothetical protein MUO97_03330 [Dehalococcoidia bacterium]|nr:hypothetical protein [Dehalococcoidia bacterium]
MVGNVWQTIVICLISVIVVTCIFFALPVVKVPVEVVETYTETEYKEEAYTEREPYTVPATGEVTGRKPEVFYDGALIELWHRVMPDRWGTEVYFTIDLSGKLNPTVSGSWKVEDVSESYYVSVTDPGFNLVYKYLGSEVAVQADDFMFAPKYSGMYVMRFSTNYVRLRKYARLTLALGWDGAATEASELTEYREVTRYRNVPVEVTKQRTVTKYEKSSVWGLFFR